MRLLFFIPFLFSNILLHAADGVVPWPPFKGRIALLKHQDRFSLSDGKYEKTIRPELISQPLRSMDADKLAAVLNSGKAYVKMGRCTDGEITMQLVPRLHGGGPTGAAGGAIAGEVVGKIVPLACGYLILYGAKGLIRVTAGKEAADAFGQTIVEQSLPHLHEVTERIAHVGGGLGAAIGAVVIPG